jgi:hypothetical protein
MWKQTKWIVTVLLCAAGAAMVFGQDVQAQTEATPVSTGPTAAAPMPRVVRYTGTADATPGQTLALKFSLYENQAGGDAVWSEVQQVTPGDAGKYSVLLGAATENGLPQNVFSSAQAKWLGVTVGDGQEQPRTILVATPYSLKASDAETLGGHPASDFALKNALSPGGTDITQINVGNGVTGGGTGPTVTLGLSTSYLESLGNAAYAQLAGNNTMTGTSNFSAGKLQVGGSPVLSAANLLASSPVTVTSSGGNVTVGLSDSALVTLGNGVYAQLGAANTFTKPITFASGQTFPGTGTGTITGVTTTSPLSGSGTSGSVALSLNTSSLETTLNGVYPQLSASNTFSGSNTFSKAIAFASGQTFPGTVSLSANNTFTGSDTFTKAITFASGQTFPGTGTGDGTITGITTTSPLSGSGTSGSVALSLNTSALESTLSGVYAGLSANNTFSGTSTFNGIIDMAGANSTGEIFVQASLTGLYAVIGENESSTVGNGSSITGGVAGYGLTQGVYGEAFDTSTGHNAAGVYGVTEGTYSLGDFGVYGRAPQGGAIGVYGVSGASFSTEGRGILANVPYSPGVMGDSGTSQNNFNPIGVLATSDDGFGAYIANNSPSGYDTLYIQNDDTTGEADPFYVRNVSTSTRCSIDYKSNFSCDGSFASIHSVEDRKLTTFGVQSAENWIEDAGGGQLSSGQAHVTLDPAFAGTVNTGVEYRVFLTPKGDCKGLFVANETASGFDVRELGGGTAGIAFDYRIMAKRKGYESVRLEDLTAREAADNARMAERAERGANAGPVVRRAFQAPKKPGLAMAVPPRRIAPTTRQAITPTAAELPHK